MSRHNILAASASAALLVAFAGTAHAQASTVESISRSTYDSTVDRTADSLHIAGATRGELGGYLDLTATAVDGSLPTGSNVCEPAVVSAALTLSPADTLLVTAAGEMCTTFSGDGTTVNAGFRGRELTYVGDGHDRVKLVREGLLSASDISWFGGQASFNATVRW